MSEPPRDHAGETDAAGALARTLGIETVSAADGACVMRLEVTEELLNGLGVCHGGVIFALADSSTGTAAWSLGAKSVAQEAAIHWLQPGRLGDVLTAHCRLNIQAGRTQVFDVTVTNQTGATVAILRGMNREPQKHA